MMPARRRQSTYVIASPPRSHRTNTSLLIFLCYYFLLIEIAHRGSSHNVLVSVSASEEALCSENQVCSDNGSLHDALDVDAVTSVDSVRRSLHDEMKQWTSSSSSSQTPPSPPSSCRLLLAPRKIEDKNEGQQEQQEHTQNEIENAHPNRKLGVYVSSPWKKGMPLTLLGGDLMLHLIDVDPLLEEAQLENNHYDRSMNSSTLSKWYEQGYLQRASESPHGGNYEGLGTVFNVLPGVAMMASYPPSPTPPQPHHDENLEEIRPNIWAGVPETDEANLPRHIHPSAGSFALHYNLTFLVTHPHGIPEGGEVLVDRWGWHARAARGEISDLNGENYDVDNSQQHQKQKQRLLQEGKCLDNLYPKLSSHEGYGRGAFATRFIPKGSIVAPVPVLPIPKNELRYLRSKEWKKVLSFRRKLLLTNTEKDRLDGEEKTTPNQEDIKESLPPGMEWRYQLLLNYCFGHVDSSVLLFPYGLFVNFINHAPSETSSGGEHGDNSAPVANVGLRWSEEIMGESGNNLRAMSPDRLFSRPNPEGLVLEYVALRDIHPDEEILFDYGSVWSNAWNIHVKNNPPSEDAAMKEDYTPAYIMEDVVSNLRTAEEQLSFPYPDNVFTACFYRYDGSSGYIDNENDSKNIKSPTQSTKAIPWKMSRGLFDMTNLRPCKVIDREAASHQPQQQEAHGGGKMFYTAIIQNRPGLPPNQRIPKGIKYIVSGIPRGAFRFVDRPYTSDEHLDGAFRQNIGLEGLDIFPDVWMDLKGDAESTA